LIHTYEKSHGENFMPRLPLLLHTSSSLYESLLFWYIIKTRYSWHILRVFMHANSSTLAREDFIKRVRNLMHEMIFQIITSMCN
jgi:hypothetical protein